MKKGQKFLLLLIPLILLISGFLYLRKPSADRFNAPSDNDTPIQFFVSKDAELLGIINNLTYYGFIKDEEAFEYALLNTNDNLERREGAILLENNNTINTEASYLISQNMNAWQIADVLLNQGEEKACAHGCPAGLFSPEVLPGGEMAPSLAEQYKWVETYDDCIKAGGQTYSNQYLERTGELDHCVSPDSEREFVEGQEGWIKVVGG